VVLEKDRRPGGTMKTSRDGGWLVETGPNSALETTPLFGQMIEALGLQKELEYANPASSKRYILRDGRLHCLPMSPGAFLASRLWSSAGKLRLLKEPFVGKGAKEETIAEFVERRLGREFLDYAINPFVAGVYAGSPEQLSVRAAFPKLYALEEKYGGLIKGMIRGAKERKQRAEKAKDRARMFSFREGMNTFPSAIAAKLSRRVKLGSTVRGVVRSGPSTFLISYDYDGRVLAEEAEAVVFSTPSYVIRRLLPERAGALVPALDTIYYPPVAEVFLGYRRRQVKSSLDGFGYLIPAKEGRSILGTIWSSSLFEGRAPDDHVSFTSFAGGSRQPELFSMNDEEMKKLVAGEIQSIMQVEGEPVYSRIIRWEKAIPQYNLGYHAVMEEVDRLEREEPGMFLCSNFRGGISVGDCVVSAERMAVKVRHFLEKTTIRESDTAPART
jgi:oxygen-dependent protoporphyrinogen oxidase